MTGLVLLLRVGHADLKFIYRLLMRSESCVWLRLGDLLHGPEARRRLIIGILHGVHLHLMTDVQQSLRYLASRWWAVPEYVSKIASPLFRGQITVVGADDGKLCVGGLSARLHIH